MAIDNRIQGYRLLTALDILELPTLLETMVQKDSPEILIAPDPREDGFFRGILLHKYYAPAMRTLVGVRGDMEEGPFHYLLIDRKMIRGFCSSLARRIIIPYNQEVKTKDTTTEETMEFIFDDDDDVPTPVAKTDPNLEFLQSTTPAKIEQALNEMVIGQPELTAAVADFLYYHILRQLHPDLPMRPLLISGPSGSGKTEVWRAVRKLYGNRFPIKIADGSNMSCDGWSGNYKLTTYVTSEILSGGILVVDEFDKLCRPKHTSKGDNVSLDMQAEFLKLLEGEYIQTAKKLGTGLSSQRMGIVLVGAFEGLRKKPAAAPTVAPIGFCANPVQAAEAEPPSGFTDEELISYGMIPEIVGRIAVKCTTHYLSDSAYLQIIRGPHSRVAQISKVLAQYGIALSDVISDREILEMVATSKSNCTGVRWVSSQVETRLLNRIRSIGLFPDTPIPNCA